MGPGVLLVTGWPIPPAIPPTPLAPARGGIAPIGTEPLLLEAASYFGCPIGFADWHEGQVLQNIYPQRERSTSQQASNSVYLEIHTETAFRPTTPDFVLLLCLRGGAGASTLVANSQMALSGLRSDIREALGEKAYFFNSTELDGRRIYHSIVDASGRIQFAEAIIGATDRHRRALAAFRAMVVRSASRVDLRPGDLLVLDNRRVVHGRTAYRPRYDGTDRWLQRCVTRLNVGEAP